MTTTISTGPDGIETGIARDLARKGLMILPVAVLIAGVWRGFPGAVGALLGCALVIANFSFGAALMTWGARISADVLLGATLFGYLIRMGLILAAGFGVKAWGYPDMPSFLFTVLITHLVLLAWEVKTIGATLYRSAPISAKE
jgi:hypothetical protein